MPKAKPTIPFKEILIQELDRRYPVEGRGRKKTLSARSLILEQMVALAEEDATLFARLIAFYARPRPPVTETPGQQMSFAEASAKYNWKYNKKEP